MSAQIVSTLIEERKQRDLTQAQVAEKMGTNQSTIGRIEAGVTDPRLSTLEKIAKVFGLKIILVPIRTSNGAKKKVRRR